MRQLQIPNYAIAPYDIRKQANITSSCTVNMADVVGTQEPDPLRGEPNDKSPQKRKADELEEGAPPEKKPTTIKISFGKKDGIETKETKMKPMDISQGVKKKSITVAPIKLSLSGQTKELPSVLPKTATVASVFNEDSESEEEEMPPEAKMRMRNIGRDTPTAAGPNSFGKGKLGFCDRQKIIERQLMQQIQDKLEEH
ncbi:hypothetical protein CHS0354_035423 [Potamilus streckersoni]|uniref:PEST proteolytic signal-containing nuclear protein n=1 Tax=Potamilus streckersoni TaxID=2493646 RepID=A0AAE0TDI7_9BIVA|nr:hypothetical protein CHS0354_035423 [Potamilus streckersoni]